MNFTSMNYEAFFVLSVLWLSIPPGKTREVNFTRVFFGKAREFSRAAMFVTSLLCRACYGLIFTSLLQLDINKLVPSCWQACYKLVANNLATALSQQPRYKSVNKLLQACLNKLGTSSANTSCWQVVGTALLQVCCRLVTTCAFLRVYSL